METDSCKHVLFSFSICNFLTEKFCDCSFMLTYLGCIVSPKESDEGYSIVCLFTETFQIGWTYSQIISHEETSNGRCRFVRKRGVFIFRRQSEGQKRSELVFEEIVI